MVSVAASLMPLVMRVIGGKREQRTREGALKRIARSKPYRGLPTLRGVDVRRVCDLITITPSHPTGVECIWYHGGSYVHDFAPQHFTFARDLALLSGAVITLPAYPLAPGQTAERTVADAAALLESRPDAVVGGDSAGGGLAMAASLATGAPRTLLLSSPWLDIRMTDPAIAELDARDPWLSPIGSAVAGELYRGSLPADDWRVSPVLADLDGLGPVTALCGDRDILFADALALRRRLPRTELHLEPGMIHNYPLLPIPEAKVARALFAERLRTHGASAP
jgi:acetyl esterase/lipase